MKSAQIRIVGGIAAFLAICLAAELAGYAQNPRPSKPMPMPAPAIAPTPAAPGHASPAMDAEREQIWNSPNMLRARAWLQEYCDRSAKITPQEKQQYMTELQNLSPTQMRLWLLKFDQEEESRQQQYGMWQQAHSAALSRAMAADQAAQKSYAAINRGESQAAGEAQQQINQQAADAQTSESNKQNELNTQNQYNGPYGPYGYQGYGGIHYHFHLYPY